MSSDSSLNEFNLLETLQQVSDPQHIGSNVQKAAEQQLKEWQSQPGLHFLLQSIYLDLSKSLQIRWLSVIQFKNGIERFWRSTRVNAISKDEKRSIRGRLFDLIEEQNNQLCIQNAQAAAKIARLDFPVDWPTLFEELERLLSNEHIIRDTVRVYNILMHVNQIIKTLGSARIGRCRPAMQSKVPLIFPLVVRIYLDSFENWSTSSALTEDKLTRLQISYLALKVLRRIITDGYERPHKDESVCEFMKVTVSHFDLLLAHQQHFSKFDIYEKFIKCYGKLHYTLITNSPASFILLPCSTQILVSYTRLLFEQASTVYNEKSDENGDFWEQTAIRSLLILKRVFNFINKKGAVILKARSDKISIDESIKRISAEFLNEQLVTNLVDTLMRWYLKLRPCDLETWFLDPEEWINEQITTSYEYQIRPCAENFFQDLINTFPELLVPYLLNKIENEAVALSDSLEDLITKDAIYASFQLSAPAVSELVDFDRLLVQVFLPEATSMTASQDQLKIIKRRVCLIINEWCTIKCSEESKKLCYGFFSNLLMNENDKVVLLTCVKSLRTMIDDWNFNKDTFQPFLVDTVTILLRKLLPSMSLTETRLYILHTLSDIIIQTKPLLSNDLLIEILQMVPKLWEISTTNSSEAILSNALIRLLRHLVASLGPQSHLTWSIALPVVAESCKPSSEHYHLLNEDGYELWGALLQNFSNQDKKLDPEFYQLLPFLEYGVEAHTEILPTLLEIVKSYALLLSTEEFFSCPTFSQIFANVSTYLLKLRDDSFHLCLEIWEILVLADEADNEELLLNNFSSTNVMKSIFDSIFKENALSGYQRVQVIQIVARIAYVRPEALMSVLSSYHQALPTLKEVQEFPANDRLSIYREMSFEQTVSKLLSIWISDFKDLYDPKNKKVHILGISSLLRTGLISVLSDFQMIASIWVEMLEEINESSGGDCEKYHINDLVTPQSIDFHPLTAEQLRYHNLGKNNDPAHNISLKEFINRTLQFLKQNLGSQYEDLMSNVDPKLLENLGLFLTINSSGD
ncbi:hypothetical protein HG536_0A07250 [Torulaspora globosa]|uniref:Importin N-terminal domain-containing protein n=1 Tax=Torulaspora globosa TaxID=48254 RepID=A0A7G3ZBM4_9SACH|nr:uncharacterized protein HG536_0A07250 [Torulaspora globosa]QLL30910.1 hypothetical protein HG536_0A07250 [Torulaspora globosa]